MKKSSERVSQNTCKLYLECHCEEAQGRRGNLIRCSLSECIRGARPGYKPAEPRFTPVWRDDIENEKGGRF